MTIHLNEPAVFSGFFGVAFLLVGLRRMFEATRGKPRVESICWGAVGVALGLAFLYLAHQLVTMRYK